MIEIQFICVFSVYQYQLYKINKQIYAVSLENLSSLTFRRKIQNLISDQHKSSFPPVDNTDILNIIQLSSFFMIFITEHC